MYGWFAQITPKAIQGMASNKGRNQRKKPFFLTSSGEYTVDLVQQSTVREHATQELVQVILRFLKHAGLSPHSAGLIIPIGKSHTLLNGLVGRMSHPAMSTKHEHNTIGVMVSGSNARAYNRLIRAIDIRVLAGTSSNFASQGGGSGHRYVAGILHDFVALRKTFLYLSQEHIAEDVQGLSSTIAYLDHSSNGIEAHLIRQGGMTYAETKHYLLESGASRVYINDDVKVVSPYNYETYDTHSFSTVLHHMIRETHHNPTIQLVKLDGRP